MSDSRFNERKSIMRRSLYRCPKVLSNVAMTKHASFFLVVILWWSIAAAQPAIIPRLSTAPHDAMRTYTIAKGYLSDPMSGSFSVVRADSATHVLIAKRNGINTEDWNNWTYCKLGPDQMLDTLEDGM